MKKPKAKISPISIKYHANTGTVCTMITAPIIAKMIPNSFMYNLFFFNADHPLT